MVSIIIPVKSSVSLENCLKSIQNSTYDNLEIIIVDSSLGDQTKHMAEKYGARIIQAIRGKTRARNLGVKTSHGQCILNLDQDMELTPRVIEECIREVMKGYDAILIPLIPTVDRKTFWGKCLILENHIHQSLYGISECLLFLFKRVFYEVGGYDERIEAPDEADIMMSIKKRGFNIGRVSATIRVHINPSLRSRMLKLLNQGKTYPLFEAKHYTKGILKSFSQVISFLLRKSIREDPIHGLGLLIYKSITGIAFLIGYTRGHIAIKIIQSSQKCVNCKQKSVQELFNRVAESYEKGFKTSLGSRYIDFLEKGILKESLRQYVKTGDLLLDLGVGFGRLSKEFLKMKLEVIGVDVSREMCKRTRENLDLNNFHVVQASMEALPFKNNSVQLVNCFRTLKYAPNYRIVLTEVYRVLRKEGILAVEVQNLLWHSFTLQSLILSRTSTSRQLQSKLFILPSFIEKAFNIGFRSANYHSLVILPYMVYSKIRSTYSLRVFISLEKLLSRILPNWIFSRNFLVVLFKERGH